jgi:hypothetical protein
MNSNNLRLALSKSKDITLNFLGRVLSSTRVEPIRDEEGVKGIKACWVGEQGKSSIAMDTGEWHANVEMETDEPPTVEYVQHGETRSVAIKNINNISCAVDRETLDQFATPRGAAIAVCAGAAAGLVGWFVVSVMRALAVSAREQDESSAAAISSENVETSEENSSTEE